MLAAVQSCMTISDIGTIQLAHFSVMAHEYKAEMKPLKHNLKCLNCVSDTYVCVSDGETLH